MTIKEKNALLTEQNKALLAALTRLLEASFADKVPSGHPVREKGYAAVDLVMGRPARPKMFEIAAVDPLFDEVYDEEWVRPTLRSIVYRTIITV